MAESPTNCCSPGRPGVEVFLPYSKGCFSGCSPGERRCQAQDGLQALLQLEVSAKARPTLTRQTELGSLAFLSSMALQPGCWFKTVTVLFHLQPHGCSSPVAERVGLLTEHISGLGQTRDTEDFIVGRWRQDVEMGGEEDGVQGT